MVVEVIWWGDLVVFLMEIVYGFGGDVLNVDVVVKIFEFKRCFYFDLLIVYIEVVFKFDELV